MIKKSNAEAWQKIKQEGLSIDVQVFPNDDGTSTAYIGGVDKDRWFTGIGFMAKKISARSDEALRDTRAVARAISRETGIPLHHSVPSKRYKKTPSRTIGRAQLKVMHDMTQRQLQEEFENSPNGRLLFWSVATMLTLVCTGAWFFAAWLLSKI